MGNSPVRSFAWYGISCAVVSGHGLWIKEHYVWIKCLDKTGFKSTKSPVYRPDSVLGGAGSVNLPWESGTQQVVLQSHFFTEDLQIRDPLALRSWKYSQMKWSFIPTGQGTKCRGTQTKKDEPLKTEGCSRNYQRARARAGPAGNSLQRQILCVSMCEVSRQIRPRVFKCTDSDMVYFACL